MMPPYGKVEKLNKLYSYELKSRQIWRLFFDQKMTSGVSGVRVTTLALDSEPDRLLRIIMQRPAILAGLNSHL